MVLFSALLVAITIKLNKLLSKVYAFPAASVLDFASGDQDTSRYIRHAISSLELVISVTAVRAVTASNHNLNTRFMLFSAAFSSPPKSFPRFLSSRRRYDSSSYGTSSSTLAAANGCAAYISIHHDR